jgi:hypothetical protein
MSELVRLVVMEVIDDVAVGEWLKNEQL